MTGVCNVCGRKADYKVATENRNNSIFICNDCMEVDETRYFAEKIAKEMGGGDFFPLEIFQVECDCCGVSITTAKTFHVGRRRVYCQNCVSEIKTA